jgi:VanZ family protein
MTRTELQTNRFRRRLWVALAGYWVLLALAIHWPMPFHASHYITGDDKIAHFCLYGGLALFLLPVVDCQFPGWSFWRRGAAVVAAVLMQGGIDELTQPLSNRTTDILDLFADGSGAIVAVLVYSAVLRRAFFANDAQPSSP